MYTIEGHPSGVDSAFDFLHSLSSGGELSVSNFLQWYSFEKTLSLLRGNYLCREDLRLSGVNAHTDGRSISFNPFQSFLYGFETVTKQSNVVGIGEVRDRYGGAHLHTRDVLQRFPEDPVEDVIEKRRGKGTTLAETRVDFG